MIGMNQIKKRLINGILIGLGIGLVIVIVILIITNNIVKGYEEGTSDRFNEQYMTSIKTVNRDIIQGETITNDMIQDAKIPKTTKPEGTFSLDAELVGKIAKYNIPRNVAITSDMLANYILGTDVRIQEINTIVMPSDLEEGEYVDIRIMMPSGIEYIVLSQKKVKSIVSTTMRLDLSEEEILTLNGAIVDTYLTKGTKLYAVKYSDPTTQIKVDDTAMSQAKIKITNELVSDLLKEGIIELRADALTNNVSQTDETTVEETTVPSETMNVATDSEENTVVNTTNTTVENSEATKIELKTLLPTDIYKFTDKEIESEKYINIMTEYAIKYRYYVESYSKVIPNYRPNDTIIKFMETSKILDEASTKISKDIRAAIESSISSFKTQFDQETYDSVTSGVEHSVSEQKNLRNTVLGITQNQVAQ